MRPTPKRLLTIAALALAPCLPLLAQDTPTTQPPAATSPAGSLKLRFAPGEGDRRVYRLHAVQAGTHVAPGKKSTFRQTIGLDLAYVVLPPAPNGNVRLQATMVAARLQRAVDGKTIVSFDSAKPTKTSNDDAELFSILPGFHFVLQVKPDGTMGDVEDREKIADQMMDKLKISADSRQYVRPGILASLESTAFKNFGNVFASFPDREVTIGSTWPKRDVVSHDSNLIYDGNLSLARTQDGMSTMNLKSTIRPDPQRARGARVLPITGTQTGYYLVEQNSGWTQRAHLEQRWMARMDESGQFVAPTTKNSRPLYMKITFDIGRIDESAAATIQ